MKEFSTFIISFNFSRNCTFTAAFFNILIICFPFFSPGELIRFPNRYFSPIPVWGPRTFLWRLDFAVADFFHNFHILAVSHIIEIAEISFLFGILYFNQQTDLLISSCAGKLAVKMVFVLC